jgi:hypothetical protein
MTNFSLEEITIKIFLDARVLISIYLITTSLQYCSVLPGRGHIYLIILLRNWSGLRSEALIYLHITIVMSKNAKSTPPALSLFT